MIKEKEIAKLLDEGKVVVIGKERGFINVNIENNDAIAYQRNAIAYQRNAIGGKR